LGKMMGASFPLYAAEHMHMTTNPIEGTYKGMPYIRDMDGYIYIKEEMGGLLMGGFEPVAKPWGMQGIPDDFQHTLNRLSHLLYQRSVVDRGRARNIHFGQEPN